MHTKFRKLTGHWSGDFVHKMMDRDRYIIGNLQFLERYRACVPSRQTCFVSIKLIHHHTCHNINRNAVCQFNCQYEYYLIAK